jgi:AcrR family transcriptional regulator
MSGLRERKKLATWRTIRATALALFQEHGFDAVSIDQIAAAAGVSRGTFFNYFSGKESVVFDQDPEERDTWRTLITSQPAQIPLWAAVAAVLVAFSDRTAGRMPLLRELKSRSPSLAQYSHDLGEQFAAELRAWALDRAPAGDRDTAVLAVNLALAAMSTAYELWRPGAPYEEYRQALRGCLERAGAGLAHPEAGPGA